MMHALQMLHDGTNLGLKISLIRPLQSPPGGGGGGGSMGDGLLLVRSWQDDACIVDVA